MPNEETKCEDFIDLFKRSIFTKVNEVLQTEYTLDKSVEMIKSLFNQNFLASQYTVNQLRQQEFECFLNPDITVGRKEWYDSQILEGDGYLFGKEGLVKNVVLLNKIRELKIFKGFTRIKPLMFEDLIFDSIDGLTGKKKKEAQRIQNPRRWPSTHTLPATEVKGEGIFIRFDDDKLTKWESLPEVAQRFSIISENYKLYRKSFELADDEILSPRFVALHTFSHLLINELSIECGYGSSSLSEMIYCSPSGAQSPMNGILIYTSSSDSEGTLGGLVEKGDTSVLNSVVAKALSKASWCSSDPLCIEDDKGKGFMGVNLASCHSCSLLPETSCCNMNKFLDRGLVIGTLDIPEVGLFV